MTWSGEFIHAAPWSAGSQGEDLVSHGCVGMSEADAAWFYDLTTKGDIVTVTGSPKPLEHGNGYTDWNVTWDEWLAGSALPHRSRDHDPALARYPPEPRARPTAEPFTHVVDHGDLAIFARAGVGRPSATPGRDCPTCERFPCGTRVQRS